MPRIIVQRNNRTYKEFLLRPFQTRITIGSQNDNNLILADLHVRDHHFVIIKENKDYYIEPINSTNDVFLNGKIVLKRTKINSGDLIEVGDHKLIFDDELNREVDKAENREQSKKENLSDEILSANFSGDDNGTPDALIDEFNGKNGADKKKDEQPHYLVAIFGPYLGKIFPLNKVTTKIGRDNLLNDIVIDRTSRGEKDTSISRRHATIVHSEGFYYILDKRSKTRTRVNKKVLKEDEVLQLYPNDEIEIVSDRESTIFRFCPQDSLNFARPKKSGTWWIRNRHRIGWLVSLIAVLTLGFMGYNFANHLKLIQDRPREIKIDSKIFFKFEEQNFSGESISVEEANLPLYSPAAADFNGDHYVDLVFFDKLGYLNVINGRNKNDLWEKQVRFRGHPAATCVLADLDGNGLKDLVVLRHNTIISAIEGTSGMEFWSSPILGGDFSGTPVIARLDDDEKMDIFAATQKGILYFASGGLGELDWKMFRSVPGIIKFAGEDFAEDDKNEIVLLSYDGKIIIATMNHDSLTTEPIFDLSAKKEFMNDSLTQLHFYDAGADNKKIICQTRNGKIILTDYKGETLLTKSLPENMDANMAKIILLENESDKRMTVLVVADTAKMVAYDLEDLFQKANATPKWELQIPGGRFFNDLMVKADFDKDKIQDIAIPLHPAGMGIISGKDGNLITSFIVEGRDSVIPVGKPVIADFGNDGFLDILQRLSDNRFQLFSTNSRTLFGGVAWGQMNGSSLQNGESEASLQPNWFYPAGILTASLLIFAILAINIVVIERRRAFFPKEIAD